MRPQRSFNLLAGCVLVLAVAAALHARPRTWRQPVTVSEPAPEATVAGVPQIIYVDASATCTGNCNPCGTTWANAFASLAEAAVCAPATGDVEVWVAQGTYGMLTLTAADNDLTFYGGFTGSETAPSQAQPHAHRSFISGNHANRCIVMTGNDSFFRGFYIVEGMSKLPDWAGAGVKLDYSNATFVDCVFTRNNAQIVGGAVSVWVGAPNFVGCRFYGNDGGWGGGAIQTQHVTISFVSCSFIGNKSLEGGAIHSQNSVLTYSNCTFTGNSAAIGRGGAIYDDVGMNIFNNCILWNNFAAREDSEIDGSLLVSTRSTVTNSIVRGGYDGQEFSSDDPLFVYAAGNNLNLTGGSPGSAGIDAADESLVPVDTYDLDWDGDTTEKVPALGLVQRPLGTGSDIGAYEYDGRPFYADFVPKNRYISLVTDNPGADVALRVTLVQSDDFPGAEGSQWWVNTPSSVADGAATIYVASLRCGPKFHDWTGIDQVHIGDAEIVPGAAYSVEAVSLGSDLCSAASYSPTGLLRTVDVWGDVAGPYDDTLMMWAPPDAVVDDDPLTEPDDDDAVLDKFVSAPGAPPLVWCDVGPNVPNATVDITDVTTVQTSQADPNHAYPFAGPVSCSCSGGCCVYGKCCTAGGSCSNTTQADCSATWTSGTMCESQSQPCGGGGRGGGSGS